MLLAHPTLMGHPPLLGPGVTGWDVAHALGRLMGGRRLPHLWESGP